ncbi:MAG: RNA methyltransferase [Acidobacteria bacterium]|nr:RNA methyltransferase [Acidobacteriota bacterium]
MKPAARTVLSSPRHPLLQQFRRALGRGELTPEGCCAVEGVHLVEEALRSRLEVVALLAARSAEKRLENFEAATNGGLRSYVTSDRIFRSLAQTETPQGIAALVRLSPPRLEEQLARPKAVAVALLGVQDPGNLGTILRALEAFGGAACLLGPKTVSPFNSKAVRASAGSLFRVSVARNLTTEKIFSLCRQYRLHTVALAPGATPPLSTVDLRGPVAFFIGQEGSGLPPEALAQAAVVARIPLAAPVESLNAAMAASLALYETARQRGFRE